MKPKIKLLFTIAIYFLLFYTLFYAGYKNGEKEEVESNASLICYSCIGL